MSETMLLLLARFGIDATMMILEKAKGVATIDDAIAACANIKTAQQYVDEDAAKRGIPARPLPTE